MDELAPSLLSDLADLVPPLTPSGKPRDNASMNDKESKFWSDEDRHPRDQALYSKKTKERNKELILFAFGLAVVLAVGHHLFLWRLNGHSADDHSLKVQKVFFGISNAFAKAVAVCLGLVVASSLTQASWYFVNTNDASINLISDLFSLPSPMATLSILRRSWKRQLIPTFAIGILAQALFIVNTLAPNALTITERKTSAEGPIPVLNSSIAAFGQNPYVWDDTVSYLMVTDPKESWDIPSVCQSDCSFDIEYSGPGISCRDLNPDEINLQPYSPQLLQNGGNWTFYHAPIDGVIGWDVIDTSKNIFNITYIPMVAKTDGSEPLNVNDTSPSGVSCVFKDRKYIAHFKYANLTAQVTADVTADDNEFTDRCMWSEPSSWSTPCQQYVVNSEGISNGFVDVFLGSYAWMTSGVYDDVYGEFAMKDLFQFINDTESNTASFNVGTNNVSQALEEYFKTATLGVLLQFNVTEPGIIRLQIPDTWEFKWYYLWLVYGPAIALVLAVAIYGLRCNQNIEITMEKTFSSYLISTRTKQLDNVCVKNFDDLTSSILRHDAQTGYYRNEADEQMTPTASPAHSPSSTKGKALTQTTTYTWTRAIILSMFTISVAASIGHHEWLSHLDGHIIWDGDQRWIRNAGNAFAQAVVIPLAIAATLSLTQASWRFLKLHGARMGSIDNLLSLPSPKAAASLLPTARYIQIVYVLMITLIIKALALVTILAPLALNVGIPPDHNQTITVPGLNLSSKDYYNSPTFNVIWDDLMASLIVADPKYAWTTPEDCDTGGSCHFTVDYAAPALSCRDPTQQEYSITPYNTNMNISEPWPFFNFSAPELDVATQWQGNTNNPPFLINYLPMRARETPKLPLTVNSTSNVQGTVCHCVEGTYRATFSSSSDFIDVTSNLLHYDNNVSSACNFGGTPSSGLSPECSNYAQNSFAICSSFAYNFDAQLEWIPSEDRVSEMIMDNVVFGEIMRYQSNLTSNGTYALSPKYANLSSAMVELFTNLTLGLLPTFNGTTQAQANITDGYIFWHYERKTLWAIYTPALTAVLVIVAYGLYCIHANGMAMDNKFSTVMITTRTEELDKIYNTAPDYAALMDVKLVYDKMGRFIVDTNSI